MSDRRLPHHRSPWVRAWRGLRARPRLLVSLALGIATGLLVPPDLVLSPATRSLLAFNAGALLFLALVARLVLRDDSDAMQHRAWRQHEGRMVVLALAVLSSAAVLVAVASQLGVVRQAQGWARTAHIALAALTVVVSWLFTQTLFALHYAHEFYVRRQRAQPDPLQFPGTPDPGYRDFLYAAIVIGTSGQTADVSFTGSALRGVGAVHCVLAFFFNATLLALTINIAAGLV